MTDADARKRGDQTGLDTLVVHMVNDEYSLFAIYGKRPSESVKYSPGEYAGNGETQRN